MAVTSKFGTTAVVDLNLPIPITAKTMSVPAVSTKMPFAHGIALPVIFALILFGIIMVNLVPSVNVRHQGAITVMVTNSNYAEGVVGNPVKFSSRDEMKIS